MTSDASGGTDETRDAAAYEDPRRLLPLSPAVFHILLALAGGERHGYAIMREVGESTGGRLRLGPGTLYRSIKQMLASGLIAEVGERPAMTLDDERRRYYRLSGFGARVARAEAERLAQLVRLAEERRLLGAGGPDIGIEGGGL